MLVAYVESGVSSTVRRKPEKFEFALPPEGLTMDLVIKNRETHVPVAKVKFDINEQNKKVVLSLAPEPAPPTVLPSVDDRNGIAVGTCPRGYTRAGAFCFKDDYDYN
ncbi:unnamed protein product [Arctia plantaginis]|uniref:Uncharacterized protein n=1 Tax=Arctia plantaginis TaxID=874455 RepID=A0A8S1BJ11_ARCPL|nr:unnamed protein product [Arctia plantaginis]CAB3260059.1 unnamed protein product [Arctia plantaginis]